MLQKTNMNIYIYIVSPAEENKEDTNDDDLNQYTRKRKRDSIGYDGPSFSLLTPILQVYKWTLMRL